MAMTGVQLQLYLGPTLPRPAPAEVVDALVSVEVRNNDRDRDGFQMTFNLDRDSLQEYRLLQSGHFEPPSRVVIQVFAGVLPQVLIDGIITNQQLSFSNTPGESRLVVTGEDISLRLDLEDKNDTHPNQSDSTIVTNILSRYATYGLRPAVTTTSDTPQQNDRVPTQQGTDLAFIRELARRNGFIFYVEPTNVPGNVRAYWGPENFTEPPQSPLSMNLGPETNLESLSATFNALGPVTPHVSILNEQSGVTIEIPAPSGLRPPLAQQPASSLRTTLPRNTANLEAAQATLRALSATSSAADAVSLSGELDAVRYGHVLRARRLVSLRGVGDSYDGLYYVKQVTHRLQLGQYRQSFSLSREGRGTTIPLV